MRPDVAFAHPGDLSHYDIDGERKRVVVVGGGIAGLTAAFELADRGHSVTLLEATDRLGGRIFTERFGHPNGPYAELGAMRIPYGHRCVDNYVQRFGLGNRHFVSVNYEAFLRFREQQFRRKDWKAAAALFGAADDPLTIVGRMRAAGPRVTARGLWGQAGGWGDHNLVALESLSLSQLVDSAVNQGLLAAHEWAWVRQEKGFGWIEDASVLFWENVGSLLDPVGRYEIEGGTSRLVEAFCAAAAALPTPPTVHLRALVSRVELIDDRVVVHCGGVPYRPFECDYAILAIPAGRVPLIEFDPRLPADQLEALRSVSYFPIAKSVALFDRRFWEADDRIFGGTSITDLPNQQIWYPSDNARPATDEEVAHLQVRKARLMGSLLADAPDEPTEWRGSDPDISEGPGALIAGYMWGINAQRFAALPPGGRDQLMIDCLRRIHPQAPKHLVALEHRVWAEHPSPGGGGFAYFRPTEQRRYGHVLCQPLASSPGAQLRVFFAGEHDGVAQGWIQGAIQSALAATISVLQSP